MEVPTIYKAYCLGLCKWISPQNMALYGTVPPCWDPGIPIDIREIQSPNSIVVEFQVNDHEKKHHNDPAQFL